MAEERTTKKSKRRTAQRLVREAESRRTMLPRRLRRTRVASRVLAPMVAEMRKREEVATMPRQLLALLASVAAAQKRALLILPQVSLRLQRLARATVMLEPRLAPDPANSVFMPRPRRLVMDLLFMCGLVMQLLYGFGFGCRWELFTEFDVETGPHRF